MLRLLPRGQETAYEGSDLSWIEVGTSKGTQTRGWAVGEEEEEGNKYAAIRGRHGQREEGACR
jgi:hypothetical protein